MSLRNIVIWVDDWRVSNENGLRENVVTQKIVLQYRDGSGVWRDL